MNLQLAGWEDIRLMGGGTNFLHALEKAKDTCEAAPPANLKLILLFTDGIADDWKQVLQRMIVMEKESPGSHFLIMGITDNQRKFYDGFNFPRPETLKALGKNYADRLIMLSREEQMMSLQPLRAPQCLTSTQFNLPVNG